MAKRNTLKQEYYKTTFNSYWKDSEGKPTIEYANWLEDKLVKKLNIDAVSVSFTDSERTEFVETTIFLNSQNLSGRETEDELYEAGIVDCFDDLIEKINER